VSEPGTGWKIDKHISIGHIITTLAVAVTALFWLANIDKRVELNTLAINTANQRIDRADTRQNETLKQILQRLESIETFLRKQNR